jgi:signal transduction histidine kinase
MEDMMTNERSSKIEKNLIKLQYLQPHDIFVQADKGKISQVIHNLLDNAIKFNNVGTIVISTQMKKEDNQKSDFDEVIISVMDTGAGIDPEIFTRLFSKFVSKSETRGTGLGLFISKSIVEAHGGKIWAENNMNGKGATFYFTLPLSRE